MSLLNYKFLWLLFFALATSTGCLQNTADFSAPTTTQNQNLGLLPDSADTIPIPVKGLGALEKQPVYREVRRAKVDDVGGEVVEWIHIRSGAHVVVVNNDDPNLFFGTTFRTPPTDNSGVFHVLKRSVFKGSRNFSVKDVDALFKEVGPTSLMESTLHPEHTHYGFGTPNSKDFDDLLDVYLDAVFFPNVVKDQNIGLNEGVRFETDPNSKKLLVNGEAFNNVMAVQIQGLNQAYQDFQGALLAKTPYAFSPVGSPLDMLDLSFLKIKEAYSKYYRPQNSFLYFYGKRDFSETLEKVDRLFLRHFTKDEGFKAPPLAKQKSLSHPTRTYTSLYPSQGGAKRDIFLKGYLLEDSLSDGESTLAKILMQALIHPDGPLLTRLRGQYVAKAVTFVQGNQSNFLSLLFLGTSAHHLVSAQNILDDVIADVVRDGLNPLFIDEALDSYQRDYKNLTTNGLQRGLAINKVMNHSWLSGKHHLTRAIEPTKTFQQIQEALSSQDDVGNFFYTHFQKNQNTRWGVAEANPSHLADLKKAILNKLQMIREKRPWAEYVTKDQAFQNWLENP